MSTSLFLLRYPSKSLFNDHWALFVPSSEQDSSISPTHGTILQVEGDPLNGFIHDIQRSVDISQDRAGRSHPELIELGPVPDWAFTTEKEGENKVQTSEGVTEMEKVALSIAPPSKTLNSTNDRNESAPKRRTEVRDCQYWVREVVTQLITSRILDPNSLKILNDTKLPEQKSKSPLNRQSSD